MYNTRHPHPPRLFSYVAALAVLTLALAARADVSARDDAGGAVVLAGPAQRIVSLSPHITELLYAAGAGGRIVGAVDYSDYPPQAKQIPRVGAYNALDMERIVALRPDLVVAWGSGNGMGVAGKLKTLGLRVFVSEPRTLEDVATSLERFGRLAGSDQTGRAAAAAFHARFDTLRRRYATRSAVSVFYQVWHRPLMTVNGEHLISRVIELCGGRNVFADLTALAPSIDIEAVLAADPQAIILSDENSRALWRTWPRLAAVQHDHVFFIHPDLLHRHTPRILDGAEQLCAAFDTVRQGH